jgi:glucose-1-phosphate thymidylyltransferase
MKNIRKGIVLAGGHGTRLYPVTTATSKQLLPIYDKPMIYYALSVLMLSNIREILIISTPEDTSRYIKLVGDGSKWGINIEYAIQDYPNGLPQAFIIGKKFINNHPCALILGDNFLYGNELIQKLSNANSQTVGSNIFACYVKNPEHYGAVTLDKNKKPVHIEEKPLKPKSNYAIIGLYFYDNQVCDIAASLKPSLRGELEITDIHNWYLKKKQLTVEIFGRGFAWMDTGTHQSLLETSNFVSTIQKRQGLFIGCLEEISYRNNWINSNQLEKLAEPINKSLYGKYLLDLIK